ncbi:MAG: hypothetical protein ACI9MR_001431 [Myxococcota bacterium]|jgi:hypothetical protein
MKFLKACLLLALVVAMGAPSTSAQADPVMEAKRIMAKFNKEPTVVAVQRIAARYARVNPSAYNSWVSEAHLAYLLPRRALVRVRIDDDKQTDVRTTSSGTGSLSDLVSQDDELQLEFRAEWDLTRLVFNRDGVAASRQIERLVNQREDVLTTVNKLYYARRQAQIEMEIDPPTSVQKAIRMQLRIDGLTADLDALTGGWFSKQMPGATASVRATSPRTAR